VIGVDDVAAAAQRLAGVAHRTPVLTSRTLDELVGASVMLKAENLQRVGAFKFRGAYNAIAALAPDVAARGVAAYSSGNHAQAVALAARLLGTTAVIVMPSDSPEAKLEATRGYGAEVVEYDRWTQDREAICAALVEDRGLTLVPPYDDPFVMAGQGTAALELIEDAGPLDVLLAPMSGGGLMAGCATIATVLCPGIRMVGVEPVDGDDHRRSLAAGERVAVPTPRTIADGLGQSTPGVLTWEINRRLLSEVVTVTDDEMVDAMVFCLDRLKTVVEPSAATVVAALLTGRVDVAGKRVGAIISGGNVGAALLAKLLSR
jgi:threonine dehydratase